MNSAVRESICAEFSVSPFHFLCFNLCFLLMVICINAESGNSILVITDSLVTHYHGKSVDVDFLNSQTSPKLLYLQWYIPLWKYITAINVLLISLLVIECFFNKKYI